MKNEKNDWKEEKKTFTQIYIVACLIICSRFAEQCISNTLKSTLSSIHVQTSTKYDITKENWDDDRAFFSTFETNESPEK